MQSGITLMSLNEGFTYDWNHDRTVELKKVTKEINNILKKIHGYLVVLQQSENYPAGLFRDQADKEALCVLCYKLGTFYCHVERDSEAALPLLDVARQLVSKEKQFSLYCWIKNHIALCYHIKLKKEICTAGESNIKAYQSKALENCDEIIGYSVVSYFASFYKSSMFPEDYTAFAYYVRSLIFLYMRITVPVSLLKAEKDCLSAIQFYEQNNLCEDGYQYLIVKQHLADIYRKQQKSPEVDKIFDELFILWGTKRFAGIFYARFCQTYGNYLEDPCLYLTHLQPEEMTPLLTESPCKLLKRSFRCYEQAAVIFGRIFGAKKDLTKSAIEGKNRVGQLLSGKADQISILQLTIIGSFNSASRNELTEGKTQPVVDASRPAAAFARLTLGN